MFFWCSSFLSTFRVWLSGSFKWCLGTSSGCLRDFPGKGLAEGPRNQHTCSQRFHDPCVKIYIALHGDGFMSEDDSLHHNRFP